MRSRFIAVVLLGSLGLWLLGVGVLTIFADRPAMVEAWGWTSVAASVGLDPDGWLMTVCHVVLGVLALFAAFTIAAGWGALAWWLGVVASLLVLWYVPLGTVAGGTSLLVLMLPGPRLAIRGD